MSIKEKTKEIISNTSRVYICIKSKQTPWYAKVIGGMAIMYALSPIDLVPDFIPVVGFLDDIIVLPILIVLTVKLIPDKVWEDSMEPAKQLWINGKPKKWYYAVPIIFIWIAIIGLLGWIIFVKGNVTQH